jgi:hypothetical protein
MTEEEARAINSARDEAKVVAHLLRMATGYATLDSDRHAVRNIKIVGSTLVYEHDGKTFHLVVYDMTGAAP